MKVLKFQKTSTSALIAHVDMLRTISHIFRRAGVAVEYSHGFNPHMELGFSSPLPLGVESLCEYVSAKTDEGDLLERLNATSPQGIVFTKVFDVNVNLAAKINRATYQIQSQGIGNVVEEITQPHYEISYLERGNVLTKDVSSRIFSARKLDENCATVTLSLGNENLRPDRLVRHLLKKHNLQCDYKITKIESFVDDISTDEYLLKL